MTLCMNYLMQFLVAVVATISFGVTFRVSPRHYLACGITGAVGWLVYVLCTGLLSTSAPVATLVAALPLTACARLFAIRHKAPITIFLLCGIFPLVPGAGIYYTAYYFIQNDNVQMAASAADTVKIAAALAIGISLVLGLPLPQQKKRP